MDQEKYHLLKSILPQVLLESRADNVL